MKQCFINKLSVYRKLTRTWYKVQSSSKIAVLNGYFSLQNLQSLILVESKYVHRFFLMVLSREFLLSCVTFFFSRYLLHNPSPPFIMEFLWVSRVPLFCSFANRACSVPVASVSPFAVFSHSFLLLVLIPSKASGWPSSLGRAEVCPSRHPHFWRILLFPFFPI